MMKIKNTWVRLHALVLSSLPLCADGDNVCACGLVIRVPGSFPGATRFFLRSTGSGTGSTQPRDDNWGAISRKWRLRSRKPKLTAVGIRQRHRWSPHYTNHYSTQTSVFSLLQSPLADSWQKTLILAVPLLLSSSSLWIVAPFQLGIIASVFLLINPQHGQPQKNLFQTVPLPLHMDSCRGNLFVCVRWLETALQAVICRTMEDNLSLYVHVMSFWLRSIQVLTQVAARYNTVPSVE
jgi:hypothetical protein